MKPLLAVMLALCGLQSTDPVTMNNVYRKLKNVHSVVLDCRLGPTLSCLVAEESLIHKLQLEEFKKEGLSKEQAHFEKEDAEEVNGGR